MPKTAKPAAPDKETLVTAYDVARLAGVSQSAVSRTFTPGGSASAETRRKVIEAAQILGWRPNLIARSLSSGRSNLVGVIIPPLENQFYPQLLEALATAFERYGLRTLLFTAKRGLSVEPILEDVLNARADALVMIAASVSSVFADQCRKRGLPIVMLNRKTESRIVSSVTGANRSGAEDIANFLVAGGHQRIAYIAGLEQSSTNRDREEAFTRQLERQDRQLFARSVGNYSTSGAREATRQLLSAEQRPDALFCANDHMALVAIDVARNEFGMKMGTDLSVVGFDDSELGAWASFSLTTYSQPTEAMANRVAHIIHQQLDGDGSVEEVILSGELIVRGSARVPPRGVTGPVDRQVWRAPLQ